MLMSLVFPGYYTINEKMYCDIHARQAAMQQGVTPESPSLAGSA
jgi:hypothetical protein